MPELLGQAKRGRKPEALRLEIRELAAKLTPNSKGGTFDVEVVPAKTPKGKPQILRGVIVPKGAVLVPFNLTSGKSVDSARETIRNGLKDHFAATKISCKVVTVRFRDDDKKESAVFYIALKG